MKQKDTESLVPLQHSHGAAGTDLYGEMPRAESVYTGYVTTTGRWDNEDKIPRRAGNCKEVHSPLEHLLADGVVLRSFSCPRTACRLPAAIGGSSAGWLVLRPTHKKSN